MNAPFKTDALPQWRLDDLYLSRTDPRIEADLAAAKAANDALAAMQGQFVGAKGEPAVLGERLARGIDLYEQALNKLWSVGAYASLAASTARDDAAWSKFEADIRARSAQIGAESLFFTLEINQIEDADLEDRGPAVANWGRLFDETLARLVAHVGKEELSLPEALNRLSDPDPARRKKAAKALASALEERTPTLALCLNTLAFEKQVEDRWRRYPDPAASRHIANEVDAEAVAAMEAAVVESYAKVSHRYYRLKARAMGRKSLDYWDRNAPLDQAAPRTYGWDEAKGMVLESFRALSPRFAETADVFFRQPWIDARPKPGKQSGAYSHSVTSERHPYVFLNYMGERRDVLTLAHELGHAVHQTLCAPLGTMLADTPLTLAETASIFGEGLVFEKLLAGASKSDRKGLLAGKIEDGLNTVVRQIAFHRFETQFHAKRQAGELSPDEIGALWLSVMGESLGPAIKLNRGYEHYWAYISHFVHSPFYVYAYTFGDLLVRALMEKRREDPTAFAPLYEDLLSAGGTRTYVEALKPFGLDPRKKAFWAAGVKQLERLVDEFAALV
jgi:oligoendopeptidase F